MARYAIELVVALTLAERNEKVPAHHRLNRSTCAAAVSQGGRLEAVPSMGGLVGPATATAEPHACTVGTPRQTEPRGNAPRGE